MKYLLIDTTTSFVTVSIIFNNEIVYNYHEQIQNDMASKIMPILEEAFNNLNYNIRDIDVIFVCNGPGSFTGIRIGVTLSKTIAWTLNKKVIPLSSLELIATTKISKSKIVSLIDARRGKVFAGIYDKDLNVLEKDSLIDLKFLLENCNDCEFVSYNKFDDVETLVPKLDIIKIIDKHKNDIGINPHKLNPNYLKKTEAEEKFNV